MHVNQLVQMQYPYPVSYDTYMCLQVLARNEPLRDIMSIAVVVVLGVSTVIFALGMGATADDAGTTELSMSKPLSLFARDPCLVITA